MATVTKGRTFTSGETVTPTKLNELADLATVTNIQTADISDSQITTPKIADSNVTTPKIADANVTTAKIANGAVTSAKLGNDIVLVPAGAIMPFAMNSAPTGWLPADGAEYSKTGTYAALFAAIGTTHGETNGSGGAGTTHFRVPDLRGYFIRGFGTNSDGTASAAFGVKQADGIKTHTHPLPTKQSYIINGSGGYVDTYCGTTQSYTPQIVSDATGGTETRPRNIALLYCIKF